jgi:hypothetical protein
VPDELASSEGADGAVEIAAALIAGIPLPPQAVLTFFPDFVVKADDTDFFKVHGESVLEIYFLKAGSGLPKGRIFL